MEQIDLDLFGFIYEILILLYNKLEYIYLDIIMQHVYNYEIT